VRGGGGLALHEEAVCRYEYGKHRICTAHFGSEIESMLSVEHFRQEVLTPIVTRFTDDESLANAYCVIWAVDAYATHMALEGVGRPGNAYSIEQDFKKTLAKRSWQFRAIREASNATKHGIRKVSAKDVRLSSDVKPNAGINFYAYFSGVLGGTTIDLDWKYRAGVKGIFDSDGNRVEGFSGFGPRIYLAKVVDAAIAAIDDEGARRQM